MKTIVNHCELEQKLLEALKQSFPGLDILCHVEVVHRDKWWACYVFAQQDQISTERFRRVIRRSKLFFKMSLISFCRPSNLSSGIDSFKRHFLYVWLPIAPARTFSNFARFNSTQTV